MMVDVAIEALKKELNHLIDNEAENTKIYEISVKLDKLIVQYYYERGLTGGGGCCQPI